jgi:hypothetical protein
MSLAALWQFESWWFKARAHMSLKRLNPTTVAEKSPALLKEIYILPL